MVDISVQAATEHKIIFTRTRTVSKDRAVTSRESLSDAISNASHFASFSRFAWLCSNYFMNLLKCCLWLFFCSNVALAGNPLVTNIFTADPSGRVFGGRLYVYTSHDEPNATYWDMVDWRLLSTGDLIT
jgi:hypothetical protein